MSAALSSAPRKRFPRGKPRVILLVDDLDRCAPERVAELLEATQLLLNTPLFLTVLALDVETVSRALHQVLPHGFGRGGSAALSYLEKIIQIPYRLRPMRAERLQDFLSSEGEGRQPWERFLDRVSKSEGALPGVPTDSRELEAIRLACARLMLGPRETKRLVNLYGILTAIWMRRRGDLPPFEVRQAAILLLGLGACHAAETSSLIDELANRFERENLGQNWKLQSALVRMGRRRTGAGDPKGHWEKLVQHLRDRDLLSPELTLNAFGLQTTDLLRAFGFLDAVGAVPALRSDGLDDEEPKPGDLSLDE